MIIRIKNVRKTRSNKYAGMPYAPITAPEGSSFKDMVALKGKPTIGDDINKKIIVTGTWKKWKKNTELKKV